MTCADVVTWAQAACKKLMSSFSADVAMGLPLGEYLRLVSPTTYSSDPATCDSRQILLSIIYKLAQVRRTCIPGLEWPVFEPCGT